MMKYLRPLAVSLFCLLLTDRAYALEQTIYIWQKSWDEGIHDSIRQVGPQTDKFSILAATISSLRGKSLISKVNTRLAYLQEAGKPVILAVRMLSSCGKLVNGDKVVPFADEVTASLRQLVDDAVKGGVVVAGVQFDYDSPTSKLANYSQFLTRVQSNYPEMKISVTTLPSWMDSPAFSGFVKPLSFYVLQLHSLETPKTIDDNFMLFDVDRSRRYVEQALKVGQKFYISLPTYGYETAFDARGQFVGLRAENRRVHWEEDVKLKIVMSDPDKVSAYLRELKGMPSPLLLGVYWFRLPVKNDELNWGVKTIQVVMSGATPKLQFKAVSETAPDGATEVFLENVGDRDFAGEVGFDVLWASQERPLFDLMGSFAKQDIDHGIHIVGTAPRVGNRKPVGWFRNANKTAGVLEVKTTKVMTYDSKTDR